MKMFYLSDLSDTQPQHIFFSSSIAIGGQVPVSVQAAGALQDPQPDGGANQDLVPKQTHKVEEANGGQNQVGATARPPASGPAAARAGRHGGRGHDHGIAILRSCGRRGCRCGRISPFLSVNERATATATATIASASSSAAAVVRSGRR